MGRVPTGRDAAGYDGRSSAALPSGIGADYYREMVLLCLKEQLALFIKLKRDISPIFPDIRLAGEMFQKNQEVPA
jgi:hypothetical protein